MKRRIASVVALGVSLLCANANGSALYSIDIHAQFYQLSQTNGLATPIGTASTVDTRDLASDTRPASYRLWTTTTLRDLVSIDPATGTGTSVGLFDPVGFLMMRTLAFDIASGKLYGGSDGPAAQLYEINPQTAAAS